MALAAAALWTLAATAAQQPSWGARITLAPAVVAEMRALGLEATLDGRVFLLVSRSDSPEPREQVGVTGIPLFGRDVKGLTPGSPVLVTDGADVRGYPLERLASLPPGRYFVQAFLNVYTTFARADGRRVALHHETGEGQDLWRSPGNVASAVRDVEIDVRRGGTLELVLDRVIPPLEPIPPGGVPQQGNPVDLPQVKFVKIQSRLLSEFWGRPMYLGANVLLPRDYDREASARYPTIYLQGHFPGRGAPFGYDAAAGATAQAGRGQGFNAFWHAASSPKVFVVTIRDANPYYDTSYSVNSANLGPFGDAITRELVPHLEQRFRMIAEPWARVLAGGSTGGWEAIAMQVFYPELFGGAWGWCPDSLDFRYHQIVNVYQDENAYEQGTEWVRVERPNARRPDGNVTSTVRQENAMELAIGPRNRSGGQWAIWEAVYGPVATDGYPQPIWDPVSGRIDREVGEYWRNHYDIGERVRREWATLGPKLTGKLHVATGDMDTYYLEQSAYLLEETLRGLSNPPANATFEYGRKKPHCWIGASRRNPGEELSNAEFVEIAAAYMAERAPRGADVGWKGR